ncbi:transmembrane gamma-carboxyglutamic acid protein 1 [Trichomycterus rosablanca]|uniref:transmembrane gamma-carboxyglutamic acid protein 1 n=1 Tax=Trichomycterus rosablanca TaxID=2290929 RepID=UPI002F3579E2
MGSVFLSADAAHAVLRRLPRANFLLEEMKQGNIQRECREEICSYEEAREAFENDEKTRRFWEEYQRESSPRPGGFQNIMGGANSLYLVLPLLMLVLLIVAVTFTAWRCHSRKRSQRSPAVVWGQRDPQLAVVSVDQWGQGYPPGPAYPGHDVTPAQIDAADPPPSYEEAVGHTDVRIEADAPPQYEDIVGGGADDVVMAQAK